MLQNCQMLKSCYVYQTSAVCTIWPMRVNMCLILCKTGLEMIFSLLIKSIIAGFSSLWCYQLNIWEDARGKKQCLHTPGRVSSPVVGCLTAMNSSTRFPSTTMWPKGWPLAEYFLRQRLMTATILWLGPQRQNLPRPHKPVLPNGFLD